MSPGRTHDFKALGHGLEQRVADVVPEAVVDDLEAVKVEEHDRHQAVDALGVNHRLLQALQQQHAVRQVGEHVVIGEVAQAPSVWRRSVMSWMMATNTGGVSWRMNCNCTSTG